MRDSFPCSINTLFKKKYNKEQVFLSKIYQQAIMLLKLNIVVNQLLPATLRPWCRVANIYQDILVLEIASANWKVCLWHKQTQLLSVLREQILPSLLSIDIKINPNLAKKRNFNKQNYDFFYKYEQVILKKPQQLNIKSAVSIRHVAALSKGRLKYLLEKLANLVEKN